MKVFLLGAGKGTRISKYIPSVPKCTLDVCGEPLIMHTIKMLKSNGITDITVVVGYKHEIIEELLKDENINIVYNPFYEITNSIASLWMARNHFDKNEETIIANADVYWTQDLLNIILSRPQKLFMLSDITHVDDGDYFFNTDTNNAITGFGKQLARANRTCEYVGIAYISSDFTDKFLSRMNKMIGEGHINVWWENVLYSYINEYKVYSVDVHGKFWAEVDYIEDYHRIIEYTQSIKEHTKQ